MSSVQFIAVKRFFVLEDAFVTVLISKRTTGLRVTLYNDSESARTVEAVIEGKKEIGVGN
jgi:hypothetical protein